MIAILGMSTRETEDMGRRKLGRGALRKKHVLALVAVLALLAAACGGG